MLIDPINREINKYGDLDPSYKSLKSVKLETY